MSQIVLKFIKLKSKDITLDSINKIKKLDFVNHSKQKKTFKFMEYEKLNRRSSLIYFDKILKNNNKKTLQAWQIKYKNYFAGTLIVKLKKSKKVDLSYAITPKYWNKKIFQQCLSLIINYLKKRKVKSINVKTRIDNFASIAVLIKFNFKIKNLKKLINENNYYYYLEKNL